jgi:hypothetical protein
MKYEEMIYGKWFSWAGRRGFPLARSRGASSLRFHRLSHLQAILTQMSQMSPHPPNCKQHDNDTNDKIEAVEPRLQSFIFVPLLA